MTPNEAGGGGEGHDDVNHQLIIKDGNVHVLSETIEVSGDDYDGDVKTRYYITNLDELSINGREIIHIETGTVCAKIVTLKKRTVIELENKSCKFEKVRAIFSSRLGCGILARGIVAREARYRTRPRG